MKKLLPFCFFLAMMPNVTAQIDWEEDWAELHRYRQENQTLLNEERKIKAVFMGNSITEGWVLYRKDFFEENNFIGRGISGQTTPQMLVRFTPDVIDLRPEVVVILAGTNDIAGNTGRASVKMITDNIKAMAQLAQANGIEVVLSSILPVYQYRWSPEAEPVPQIQAVNQWLQEYAKDHGHQYVDYYSALVDERKGLGKEYSEDGVHPKPSAFQIMEPLVLDAIKKVLGE